MSWRDDISKSEKYVDWTFGKFVGTLKGGEFVDGKFGPCLRLTFTDEDGFEKTIDTKSVRLQKIMKNIPDGTKVKIFRNGEGFDTHYEVEIL